MTKKTTTPASYRELVTACPDANSDFICRQLAAKATAQEAASAWTLEQADRLAAQAAEISRKRAELETAKPAATKPAGVEPIKDTKAPRGSSDDFESAVAEYMEANDKPRHEAVRQVCRRDPEMRRQMLSAHNEKHGRRHAVEQLAR